ncbi:MAG: hypothetical protein COB49_05400 [Alphaproteobacteria bacterium]|nr:MAG: hypothetical protein COB49_05400 [Alphaproteobacteria bacterium]
MAVFEMVVWIVAISVIGGVVKSYMDRKHKRGSSMMDDLMNDLGMDEGDGFYTKKDLASVLEKFEAMEARIQVLERIATDKGQNLAAEIDNLK